MRTSAGGGWPCGMAWCRRAPGRPGHRVRSRSPGPSSRCTRPIRRPCTCPSGRGRRPRSRRPSSRTRCTSAASWCGCWGCGEPLALLGQAGVVAEPEPWLADVERSALRALAEIGRPATAAELSAAEPRLRTALGSAARGNAVGPRVDADGARVELARQWLGTAPRRRDRNPAARRRRGRREGADRRGSVPPSRLARRRRHVLANLRRSIKT